MPLPATKFDKRSVAQRARYARSQDKRRNDMRERRWVRKYGITKQQRDAMLAAQDYCCAACATRNPGSKKGFMLHHTGVHPNITVHGLLCHPCNIAALQGTQEDIQRLRNLADKLEEWLI